METTKTILEWLNEIEEPEIREAAIKYAKERKMTRYKELSLSSAICGAFIWDVTSEGHGFWDNYHERLISQGK